MRDPIQTDLEKTFAAPAAACPASAIGEGYAPFDHYAMHAHLARARAEEPVFYATDLGYWVVTRYDDVFAILRDPDRFSAANANTPIVPLCDQAVAILQAGNYQLEAVQVNCDPPRHTRIRASAQQAMSLKALLSLEDHIRELVVAAIGDFSGNRIDLLQELTYELPARTIFKLLDISESDARKVKDWSTNRFLLGYSRPTPQLQVESAENLVKFWRYCTGLVADRMENPGTDFVSRLLDLRGGDDAVLTVNEVNSLAFGLMFAGHETTTSQTTNTLNALLEDPALWRMLCADPALIPNAVEEGLRMYGAVVNWRRRAKEDVEIAGVKIPKDSNLLISFTSANRDAAVFPDPDRFDPHRANARKHLTFGNGIHHCLGAPLARLEMRIMIEELTRRFPRMARVPDRPVKYKASFAFRVPESLWVDLEPAS
ncbi:cytochrome P450 [Ruixingdingia sedimenti]|uniref:Cytochrome P450 n=1 Tax=Ruixingdingia sedimenti TaxID=3073604 RepID=A0ABU1F3P5_9RHOB|nr:cytochrome P450 [Xinfangfangia sp. LG-4]MDR5651499.1 cytochrome P450 [Xinfangfangia sp. LG-4]